MQVILTADVDPLGRRGDVVDVAVGYARNYLVPRSLAVAASAGAVRQAEAIRAARAEAEKREKEEAELLAAQLTGTRVVLAARAGDEGKLFGSIGAGDVAAGIAKFTGVEIDRGLIEIVEPIKEIGLHEVTVRTHRDVAVTVTLDVIPA
ncbi:MAG: 50S ribosomal protein L9 [Acidimicrobiia bacterium]